MVVIIVLLEGLIQMPLYCIIEAMILFYCMKNKVPLAARAIKKVDNLKVKFMAF